MPLKYKRNRIYGILGVDTLQEPSSKSYFQEHEVKFYQVLFYDLFTFDSDYYNFYKGVATTFAKAYANIVFKNRLIKCCISAIDWIVHRCRTVILF